MIFSGFFPKELIYLKSLPRASKFGGKMRRRKLKQAVKADFSTRLAIF
jgi:hypothetical protein